MNTDKTLTEKFAKSNDKPIWYYKELEEIDLDYVIWYLLQESFVVELDGYKYEITFGKNRKHEIGTCIRYDEFQTNAYLAQFEVIRESFKRGKWFIITEQDTTEKFKQNYNARLEKHHKTQELDIMKDVLTTFIKQHNGISDKEKDNFVDMIENNSYEMINKYFTLLLKGNKDKSEVTKC